MEYHLSYLRQVVSRAFGHSSNHLGIGSQIVIDLVFYIYFRRIASPQLGDFMLGLFIVAGVFLIIFLIYLLWEFRWAIPDIKITARRQLVENANIMVVFDVYNNEVESLTECYLKLNKYTIFFSQ